MLHIAHTEITVKRFHLGQCGADTGDFVSNRGKKLVKRGAVAHRHVKHLVDGGPELALDGQCVGFDGIAKGGQGNRG